MIRLFSSANSNDARAFARNAFAAVAVALLAGCSGKGRDPFTLRDGDINPNDLNNIGAGYAWTSVKLGSYINGHGLPAERFTFAIVRKKDSGKPGLVWPVFAYGMNQANAAALNGNVLFGAALPDGNSVLMAAAPDDAPPVVVSPAILRLAARRLGTLTVVPGRDCAFAKVRSIPGRIWLQASKPGAYSYGEKLFSLELTPEDLTEVINETRQRGRLITTNAVRYIAEPVSYSHIEAGDAKEAPDRPKFAGMPEPKPRKGEAYTPQADHPRGQALVDSKNHFAYFGTGHEPGRVLKVDLRSKTGNGPEVVGALVFEPEEDRPFYCAMDERAEYGYFGTDFPGKLVKVALGTGAAPPTRIGSVLLDEHYNVRAGVVDSSAGYACFNIAQRLCKVKLGEGDDPPSLASVLDLTSGPSGAEFVSAVFDPISHCAYFGTDYKYIYKVNLGVGDAPPRIVGILTLPDAERGLRGALIDPRRGYAWFTSHSGYIVKIALGGPEEPPTRVGSLKLEQRYEYLEYTFGMDEENYGYYGAISTEVILKVALGTKNEMPVLKAALQLPESRNYVPSFGVGIVDSRGRMMCLGIGSIDCVLMRLALGEGNSPPRILDEVRLYAK